MVVGRPNESSQMNIQLYWNQRKKIIETVIGKRKEWDHMGWVSIRAPIKRETSHFLVREMNGKDQDGTVLCLESKTWGSRDTWENAREAIRGK